MDLTEIFKVLVRWAHMVSAAAWVGGSIFWLLVLRPSIKQSHAKSDETRKRFTLLIAKEFKSLVDTCIFVLLATGAIMTFERLTPSTVGVNYVLILGAKIIFVAIMFYIIRAKRQTRSLFVPTNHESEPISIKLKVVKLLSGYNLIVVLGLLVFLLSDLLSYIYYASKG